MSVNAGPPGFATRVGDIEPFRVVAVLERATRLAAAGEDIVHMAAGEPDFVTAGPIVEAGRAALARGETHYSQAAGIPALREAISAHYAAMYGLDIGPERIMVTPGASGALLLIAALLVEPGKGMLMTDPGYPCNRHFMRLVEGRGQLVPVSAEDNYQLNDTLVAEHWRDNTIGALVASPANPTGSRDVVIPGILSSNTLTVEFETTGVPLGTTITLTAKPVYRAAIRTAASTPVSGSVNSGTATVDIDLANGENLLEATAIFDVVASLGQDFSNYARGESVEKVKVAVNSEGQSITTFISASGNEYPWPSSAVALN